MKSIDLPDMENAFLQDWSAIFGPSPPLSYILCHDFYANWARFHALPKSKQYADTTAEREIILSRANSLVAACFPKCESLWLVTAEYGPSDLHRHDLAKNLEMKRAFSWADEREDPDDRHPVTFFAKKIPWKPHSLDWLFTEVAEERGNAIFFEKGQCTAFAPYDGGFDIISLQQEKIDALKGKFPSWMPERPDKL